MHFFLAREFTCPTSDKISQIPEGGPVWRINASFSQATGYVSSESFVKRFDWRVSGCTFIAVTVFLNRVGWDRRYPFQPRNK